ncbi:hypothetical protein BDP27DRAFT_1407434 [Rhodocollybia butyracea]|uniref:Uncharacterized protein n=1 Tax=Rhodocollybia butyracea TaxID=206335 RepID=A0A9P5PA70_9AGAR|nr:hypothetical protein BDP27DRAFT_1407434 [Rhodocollybia butyracea]
MSDFDGCFCFDVCDPVELSRCLFPCCHHKRLADEVDELSSTRVRNNTTERHESKPKSNQSQSLDQPEPNSALLALGQPELQAQQGQNPEGSSQEARLANPSPPPSVPRHTRQPSSGPVMEMLPNRPS